MSEDKVRIKLQKELLESERKEKKQKRLRKFLIVLLCLMCLLSGTFLGIYISKKSKGVADVVVTESKYDRIATYMNSLWLYGPQVEDLDEIMADSAYRGMVEFSDDIYTTYFSKEEAKTFSDSINGDYVGIGCQFSVLNDFAIVTKVFKDSPCEKAGMQAGDIFYEINGEPAEELTSTEIKERVQGEAGTYVYINVIRGNEQKTLQIKREKINYTAYAYAENDYVVLELNSFGNGTAKEIKSYLNDYTDYSKIIIDVRGNGGGYETSVQEVVGLFIGQDKVVLREIDKDENEKIVYSTGDTYYDNFKTIVLLTNGNTASAAEVFTIALKEMHENCIQVGETTYGKGVVQATLPLGDGSYVKITRSYWLSPNGESFNGVGVEPDEEVYLHDLMYQRVTSFTYEDYYEYDDNNDAVKFCQLALDFLGYDVDRKDGYFSKSTAKALNAFKSDNALDSDGILDYQTYRALASEANYVVYTDKTKDNQWIKALELVNSN